LMGWARIGTNFALATNACSEAKENRMLDWMKRLPTSHLLGWVGVGLLAIVIVLVFVRRLVGMDG